MYTLASSHLTFSTNLLAVDFFGNGGIGGLLWTLLIGLVVGVIAKLLTPGRDPGGCIITSLIGIVGAFLAYYVGSIFGHYGPGSSPGLIASTIGAVVVLVIYHLIVGRKGGGPTV